MKKPVIIALCLLLCAAIFTTAYNIKEKTQNNKNDITAVTGVKNKSVKTTAKPTQTTTSTTIASTAQPTTYATAATTTKIVTTTKKVTATKAATAQNKTPATTAFTYSLSDYEQQVVNLVNAERANAGLPAYSVNLKLSYCARCKAQDMYDNNYFSHTSPTYGTVDNMIRGFGISFTAAGENIAMGYTTPQAVMNGIDGTGGWMNSQGHRDNILSTKYTQIGVGYVASGNYWVQQFIN